MLTPAGDRPNQIPTQIATAPDIASRQHTIASLPTSSPHPPDAVPTRSRGAELGAIRICHGVAVNGRFRCRYQSLERDSATRNRGQRLSERLWPYSCSYVPHVSQRMRRRSAQRQSRALTQQKREDDAWLPLPALRSYPTNRRFLVYRGELKPW
jgi:hypothetical protein